MAQTSKADITVHNKETYDVTTDVTFADVTIESGGILTVKSGAILTVTGTLISQDVTCLVIEDGGQLVYVNDDAEVNATVHKNIEAYADNTKKWYTISNPMTASYTIVGSSSFCDNDYKLFQYQEEGHGWIESTSQDPLFSEQTGLGYVYANKNAGIYQFQGVLNTNSNIDVVVTCIDDGDLKGFNLVGNPFPHDIYKGYESSLEQCAIYSSKIATGYYTIDGNGSWATHSYNDPIKPCQGVLIKLNESINNTDKLKIYNKTNLPNGDKKRKRLQGLCVSVSGNTGNDRTFVYFNKGIGLDKINHKSDIVPYLCVNYENKNYAIAHVDKNCRALDVVFRNNQTGFFTLNVEDGLSDFSYLHLIDNITGDDVDLLLEPSYKFAANGNEYESRFKLVFAPNSNDNIDNTTFAYISNNDIIISGVKEKATLQVYDVTGRMIKSEIVSGVEGSISRVAKPNVAGVYVLRLIESNNVNTQKLVVE